MDTVQNLILAAGPDAYAANDFYTEEQYKRLLDRLQRRRREVRPGDP